VILQGQSSRRNPDEVANDCETKTGALWRFVCANAALHDSFSFRWLNSGAVVINRNHDLFALFRTREPDPAAPPRAGIVQ
jgi:hypothetical protein